MATRAATTVGVPRPMFAGRSPFVGRERELAALETMLSEAASGGGRVALIAGEPGIGKSRLLAQVAERAAAGGWLVLSGRAYDAEGVPPYLPFIEALRQYMGVQPVDALRAMLGRGAPEVAVLIPELWERIPEIEPSPPLSRDERFRLFEAVTAFFLNIAQAAGPGLLVCLEDFHRADDASLRLLEHLGHRLPEAPLLVVATCRTAAADRSQTFNDVMAALRRERLCEQMDVPPFSEKEAARLVEQLTGLAPARAVVEAAHRETGGNPFFLEEVVRHLCAEGRDLTDDNAVRGLTIPESVRQVIGVRLSRLQPDTLRALQAAAALGDPFSFDTLAAAVGGSDLAPMLDALDEASASGFLREDGSSDYRFSHALVRETVYAGLSAPRRALLHAQVAEKLEAFHQEHAAAHAGELAHHFLLGGRRGDLVKAMGYALQAADSAMGQLAFDHAVRYYQMALDADERSEKQDRSRRCEMLLALATATFKAGDWDRCDEINLTAAEAAKAAGLPDLLARACLATAAYSPRPNARLTPLLEYALTAFPAGDSLSRSGLLSLLACQRSMAGSWEESAPMREESVVMARRLGDVRALAFALRNAYIEWNPNRLQERREAVQEVVQLARELGDRELEVTSQCDHLTTSLLLNDIAAVDAGIEAHVRLGDELQQRMQIAHGLMLRGMRALLSGPLSHAEELNAELQRFCRRYSQPWAAPSIDVHTLLLRWEQGRLAELAPVYQARQEGEPSLPTLACLAFICAESGNTPEARAVINQLDPGRLARVRDRVVGTFSLCLLSHSCAAAGATAHADVVYSLLLPRAGDIVTVESAAVCLGSTSRYLGMLAATLGRFDEAERRFDDSDAMNTRLGAGPLLAHTKVDRAWLHLARQARGDLQRARVLLDEAASDFAGLGIDYHAGKARGLLESLPQGGPARALHPAGLSAREVEVLRLIAGGLSSREIGEELVLSVRTVERHIANIYLKTDTHGRAQVTAYALAHGLGPQIR